MKTFLKVVVLTGVLMAAFIVPACATVGVGALFEHWFGDTWYAGLLAAVPVLVTFCGGLSFFLWLCPKVGDWVGI